MQYLNNQTHNSRVLIVLITSTKDVAFYLGLSVCLHDYLKNNERFLNYIFGKSGPWDENKTIS